MPKLPKEKPRLGGEARKNRDNHNNNSLSKYKGSDASAYKIAVALDGKKSGHGWLCRCPSHDDSSPSLSIKSGDGGKPIFFCHAGCSYKDSCGRGLKAVPCFAGDKLSRQRGQQEKQEL